MRRLDLIFSLKKVAKGAIAQDNTVHEGPWVRESRQVTIPGGLSDEMDQGVLSPTENRVLSALYNRTSLGELCERLDFEYSEQQVLESLKSLLGKEVVVVVCSSYPWGVEFDYLSKEVALREKSRSEVNARTRDETAETLPRLALI